MVVQYKDMVFEVKGYRVEGKPQTFYCIEAGSFKIYMDKVKGEAPSPIEYVLAALAGCFNVVGFVVAKELNIEIESLDITVRGVFNAEKLYTGRGERAGFKQIEVEVKVKSSAPREILEKWLKSVEERCPVRDNLVNHTPVVSKLV